MKTDVPFPIGFAIILAAAFFAFEIASQPSSAQTALALISSTPQNAIIPVPAPIPAPTETPPALATVTTTPGLLPVVTLVPPKKTVAAPAVAAAPKQTALKPAPKPAAAPTVTTAQAFLANTTLTPKPRGSSYEVALTTNLGGGKTIAWGFDTATLAGTGSLPELSVAYSCDPPPTMPLPGAADQNPSFDLRASYTCTVTLTPLAGSDRRAQSKSFSFTTDAGPLVVSEPSSMGTVLHNGENDGGIVFNNEDTLSATVTGLTLDISYAALNTGAGPLVLRFLDPATGTTLGEYHLENLPTDPSRAYTHAGSVNVPLFLALKPSSQKMLPMQLLGASVMGIPGIEPTLTLAIRNVTTESNNVTVILNAADLSWSCTVPLTGYDPNATSGPYATGDACR